MHIPSIVEKGVRLFLARLVNQLSHKPCEKQKNKKKQ